MSSPSNERIELNNLRDKTDLGVPDFVSDSHGNQLGKAPLLPTALHTYINITEVVRDTSIQEVYFFERKSILFPLEVWPNILC